MKTTQEIAQAAWNEIGMSLRLNHMDEWDNQCVAIIKKAIEAAKVQGEPVAVFHGLVDSGEHGAFNLDILKMIPRGANLYTAPPKRQPLTPEKARELWVKHRGIMDDSEISYMAFMGTFRHFEAAINGGGA